MNHENDESDIAAALDAARPLGVDLPLVDGRVVTLLTPNDVQRQIVDLERYGERPVRSRGNITTLTAAGFTEAVVLRASGIGSQVVYADHDKCALVAVLNDDLAAAAGWRDYRVLLELRSTPEWAHWTTHQGLGAQAKFAEAIEEGENEIVEPAALELLELAQTFHAHTAATFKQGGRLKDGRTQFVYEEDVDAKAGESGQLTIPSEFTVALRPFHGATPVKVKARLRWRLSRGELQIGYFLHRVDDIRRAAFAEVVDAVRDELSLPVVEGVAPPVTTC